MIKERFLLEWAEQFPWRRSEQVEQDLLISRAVVAIYSDPYLAERLAWRGGTALYKLYLTPQPRYSEDIDLVLIHPEPMGPILDRLREVLSFIPDKQAKGKRYSHVLKLRFVSEANAIPCRIKVEINCNEHFSELGFAKVPFKVSNSWFSGACEVTAYKLEEMLGTKFNAVFGRKKTRDLFDMDYVFKHASPDVETILRCWRRYKKELNEELPSWREFVQNVEAKLNDPEYRHGMDALLRPEVAFDPDTAWQLMQERIVNRLMTEDDIAAMQEKMSNNFLQKTSRFPNSPHASAKSSNPSREGSATPRSPFNLTSAPKASRHTCRNSSQNSEPQHAPRPSPSPCASSC